MSWFDSLILEEQPDGGQEDYHTKLLSSAASLGLVYGEMRNRADPSGPNSTECRTPKTQSKYLLYYSITKGFKLKQMKRLKLDLNVKFKKCDLQVLEFDKKVYLYACNLTI